MMTTTTTANPTATPIIVGTILPNGRHAYAVGGLNFACYHAAERYAANVAAKLGSRTAPVTTVKAATAESTPAPQARAVTFKVTYPAPQRQGEARPFGEGIDVATPTTTAVASIPAPAVLAPIIPAAVVVETREGYARPFAVAGAVAEIRARMVNVKRSWKVRVVLADGQATDWRRIDGTIGRVSLRDGWVLVDGVYYPAVKVL